MDCFPAYIKGDATKKLFASIDIVADETLVPDEEATEEECPAPAVALTAAEAGCAGWTKTSFDGDPKKVDFKTLGTNLKVTIDRSNLDFSGTLKRIDNWTAFSSDPKDLTGYYFPFSLEAADGTKLVRTTLNGSEKTLVFGQTGDGEGKMNLVWAIDPENPVISAKLVAASAEKAAAPAEVALSLDFSRCVFK